MAIKKSKKKKVVRPKISPRKAVVEKPSSHLGFIERIVRPKEKEVRVKTFIVERPVYISSDKKFPARGYDLPEKEEMVYDSRKSRYVKKKQQEKEVDDYDNDSLGNKENSSEEFAEDNFDEQGNELTDEQGDEQLGVDENQDFSDDELDEEQIKNKFAHQRSGLKGLLENWWKKAIVFGVLWWLALLAFAFVMQVFGLVIVDLTRDWWVFLGIILALNMVYQKFLSGKI